MGLSPCPEVPEGRTGPDACRCSTGEEQRATMLTRRYLPFPAFLLGPSMQEPSSASPDSLPNSWHKQRSCTAQLAKQITGKFPAASKSPLLPPSHQLQSPSHQGGFPLQPDQSPALQALCVVSLQEQTVTPLCFSKANCLC